jgi:ribosome-binding factor A
MNENEFKNDRGKEVVTRLASQFIQKESNSQSMITVTNVSVSSDFKSAVIMISVLPEHKQEAALDFLKRNRKEFKDFVKQNSRLGRIPHFDFAIDMGEKSRQRIEEIL